MPQKTPTDDQMLKKIGLADADLRDMQVKINQLTQGLNPAQKKSLKKSLPTSKQAAATLGPGVTSDSLEKFIRARAPAGASLVLYNGGGSSITK